MCQTIPQQKKECPTLLSRLSQYMPLLVKQLGECTEKLSNESIDRKTTTKCLRYAYSLLKLIMFCSHFSTARDQSKHLTVDRKCLSLMKVIVDCDVNVRVERSQHLDRVFALSSLVIQILFEPMPLTVSEHNNPFVFHIPLNEINDANDSNSGQHCDGNECNLSEDNEVYGSDTEDDIDSDSDDNESQSIDRPEDEEEVISYEQFFTEIKDFDWNLKLKVQTNENK